MKTTFFILLAFFVNSISFSQSGWFAINEATPNITLDGIQFTSINTGYAVGYNFSGKISMITKTTNAGLNWQKTFINNAALYEMSFANDLTGYVGGKGYYGYDYIFKTTNGGINWIIIDSLQGGSSFDNRVRMRFCDANTGLVFSDLYYHLYKTTNGGNNWISTDANFTSPNQIYNIDANNWVFCLEGSLDVSTNGGVNWIIGSNTGFFAVSFINNQTGFGTSHDNSPGQLFKTINGGISWTQIFPAQTPLQRFYHINFRNENTGYRSGQVDTNNGVIYKTTNGGYNWSMQYSNRYTYLNDMYFIDNNTGYCAGSGGLIFKTTTGGEVFVSNISSEVPDKFELGQNYPNPFNQSTIFNLQCSMKGNVSVKVFDAAGREVQTLVNETLAPGTYQVRFDGSGLASGLYYYQLAINKEQLAVKKMVMVK